MTGTIVKALALYHLLVSEFPLPLFNYFYTPFVLFDLGNCSYSSLSAWIADGYKQSLLPLIQYQD